MQNAEQERLTAARTEGTPWLKWGPYRNKRQGGTVREDYSLDGDAWNSPEAIKLSGKETPHVERTAN